LQTKILSVFNNTTVRHLGFIDDSSTYTMYEVPWPIHSFSLNYANLNTWIFLVPVLNHVTMIRLATAWVELECVNLLTVQRNCGTDSCVCVCVRAYLRS